MSKPTVTKAFNMGWQVLQYILWLFQVKLNKSVQIIFSLIFRLLFLVSIVDNTFGGDEAALECDTQGKIPRYIKITYALIDGN